jgi:hypothetical protein
MGTMDEDDMSAEQQQCLMALRDGKRLLKDKQGASSMVRFEKALMLAKSMGEKIYERRATRGLAAAARLQVPPSPCCGIFHQLQAWIIRALEYKGVEEYRGASAAVGTTPGFFRKAEGGCPQLHTNFTEFEEGDQSIRMVLFASEITIWQFKDLVGRIRCVRL